jgi:hypothetical protein
MRGTDILAAPVTADDDPGTRDVDPRPAAAPVRRGPRFPRLGVAAAVVLIAFLAGLAVFAVRPFASADESAHADYGLTIYQEHRLPTLFDRVEQVFPFQQAKPQHVANHPPLYYLLTGPFLAAGQDSGHLVGGYLLARGVSVLASMATVLLVAGFTHAVTRGRRPAVTVGAAALVAAYAPFVSVSGVLHNDAVSVAFSTGVLWLTVLVLRRGPSWPLVAAIAVTALGGTAVRATNASLVLTACLAVVLAGILHADPQRRWTAGLATGLVRGFLVGLTSLLGIGWFFLRSQQLYGNMLGYGVLEDAFGKTAPPESLWMFRNPVLLFDQIGLPRPAGILTPRGLLTVLPVVAVLAGCVLLLLAAVRRRRATGRSGARPLGAGADARTIRWALAALFAVHTLITLVMVMRHVDGGGGTHPRYLFPLLPIVAAVAAAALLKLPGGRRGVYLVAAVAAGVVSSLQIIGISSWRWLPGRVTGPTLEGIRNGLAYLGLPAPAVLLVGTLTVVVAATAVVAWSVWRAGRARGSAPDDAPAEPVEQQPRPALA